MAYINYVSITAGKDAEEANAVLNAFQAAGYSMEQGYAPAIGIQVSEKTLNGIKPNNLRLANFAEVPSLLKAAAGNAMPVIHYNTKNTDTLFEQVSRVFESCYGYCKTVQINAAFPEMSYFVQLKSRFPEMRISLQVDYRGIDIAQIPDKVASYGDSIDYVLIDPSRGRGDMFDIEDSAMLYLKIKEKCPDYGIVIAGGLSGDNIEEVLGKFIDKTKTKDFSICAEGKLRDKASDEHWGMDVLNIENAIKYLQSAKKILEF